MTYEQSGVGERKAEQEASIQGWPAERSSSRSGYPARGQLVRPAPLFFFR